MKSLLKKIHYKWHALQGGFLKAEAIQHGELPLVICCIFKNEAPFLKEWVDFHLTRGFQRIYLINNRSNDNYEEVLQPYIQKGVVCLADTRSDNMSTRIQALEYNLFLPKIKAEMGKHCWVAFLDVDEYLFSNDEKSVQEVLQYFAGKKVAAVLVNWLMFGTSGVKKLDPKRPMVEQLTRRAPLDYVGSNNFKSIAYLANTYCFFDGPHRAIPKGGAKFYYSDGTLFTKRECRHNPLRINHYWYRSEEYYFKHKREKRKAFGYVREKHIEEWDMKKCNEVEDREVLKRPLFNS